MVQSSVVQSSVVQSSAADPGPCHAHPSEASPSPATVSLARLRRGQTGVIREARLSTEDAALLRAMGLRDSARVRLCRVGEPCIVAISSGCGCAGTCRIGLARPLAERIMVSVDA